MNIDKVLEVIENDFKGKAFNEEAGNCSYLTEEGKKCFVGLFIPDGHEAQSFRGSVGPLLRLYPDLKDLMPTKDEDALNTLQQIHDETILIDSYYSHLDLPEQITYLQLQALRILGE